MLEIRLNIFLLLIFLFCGMLYSDQIKTKYKITVDRHKELLISPQNSKAGDNICGPCVIRVPEWVKNPLGKYYMYFARHSSSSMSGAFIRFAYSDSPKGPWTVNNKNVLRREDLIDISRYKSGEIKKPLRKKQHIASPDVLIDHENKKIVMYFHGSYKGHNTGAAVSEDGLNWKDKDIDLGAPYLRVFKHNESYYGVSQGSRQSKSTRFIKLNGMFEVSENHSIPNTNWRHHALLKKNKDLLVFYSRYNDAPGRIQASIIDLSNSDFKQWEIPSSIIEVLKPEHAYEGSKYPVKPSGSGRKNLNEVRDPYILDDEGRIFLYYSVKGEMGIAVAELTITEHGK